MRKIMTLSIATVLLFASVFVLNTGATEADFHIINNELVEYKGDDTVVSIPQGVQTISSSAFKGNQRVTKVVLPNSLETIEDGAFKNCTNLTEIITDKTDIDSSKASFENTPFLNKLLENDFSIFGGSLLSYNKNEAKVVIPSGITSISSSCFRNNYDIMEVLIPEGVEYIRLYAFENMYNLRKVTLPESLLSIENSAFANSPSLKTLKIPVNVGYIGKQAVGMIHLEEFVSLGNGVTMVPTPAFSITGASGSLAQTYAKENNITFIVDDTGAKVPPMANRSRAQVTIDNGPTRISGYNINDNNYFKLRDVAYIFNGTKKQFDVKWDGALKSINLVSGKGYEADGSEASNPQSVSREMKKLYKPNTAKIYKDGKEVKVTSYNIGGNNYFKLRDLTELFNVGVTFDNRGNGSIHLNTKASYTKPQ